MCRGIRDCEHACLELVKLIKFSPKREAMLEKMKMKEMIMTENYDDLEDETNLNDNAPLRVKNSHALDKP